MEGNGYGYEQKPTTGVGIHAKPISPPNTDKAKGFKPFSLRTGPLLVLLAILLTLIGLLEYACRKLPSVDRHGTFNVLLEHAPDIVVRRDILYGEDERGVEMVVKTSDGFTKTIVITHNQLELRQILIETSTSSSIVNNPTFTPNPEVFLNTTIASSSSSSSWTPIIASTAAPSVHLNTKITTRPPSTPSPSVFLDTNKPTSTGPPKDFPPLPVPSVFLGTDGVTQTSYPGQSVYVDTQGVTQTSIPGQVVSVDPSGVATTILPTPTPGVYLCTSAGCSASLITVTGDSTTLFSPNPTVFLCTTTGCPAQPTNTIDPFAQGTKFYLVNGPKRYFLGTYAPTILAIFLSFPITIIALSASAMEPFYQLARSGGAASRKTLLINYHSVSGMIKAFIYGHWAVALTILISLMSIVIAPLAPTALFIHLIGKCSATTNSCTGSLGVYLPAARAIEGLLAGMAILLVVLILVLHRRWTGVYSDPRSIVGLGVLFTDPRVRNDFHAIGDDTDDKSFGATIDKNEYRLDTFTHDDGAAGYGLVHKDSRGIDGYTYPPGPVGSTPHGYQPAPQQPPQYAPHPYIDTSAPRLNRKPTHLLPALLLIFVLLALLAMLFTYHYTSTETPFENFMRSQNFGVRFLFTSIGVGIKLYWEWVYEWVATMAPYHHLTSVSDPYPIKLLLLPNTPYPLTSLWPMLKTGRFTVVLLGMTTLLSVPLTVVLTSIPFSNATAWSGYIVSHWLSVAIVAVMLLTLILLCFYKEPVLPVKPDVVGARLYYLYRSRTGEEWRSLALMETKARDRVLRSGGAGG